MKYVAFLALAFFSSFLMVQAATILFPNGGGTGWGNIQTGAIPYGQGTGRFATTTQGTNGYVLAWLNGIPTWTATSTTGLTAYDAFTHTSAFGQTVSATTSGLWLQGTGISLMASSTAWFDQVNVGSSTVSTMATSTFYGNIEIKGRLKDDSITSALIFDDSTGLAVPYAGTACTNQFVRSLNAAGSATCNTVALGTDTSGNYVASVAQTYGTAQTGAVTLATSTTAISNDWGITNSSGAFTFNLPTATASVRGLTSATDFATFSAKQAPGFQVSTTSAAGVSKLAYFTSATPTTLGGVATTSVTAGTGLTGTLTTLGSGDAVSFAAIAANSLWANKTGGSAVPTAIATSSLGIAISDTTGTLLIARGGTGQTTFTSSQLLYGNGTAALSSVATSSETCTSPLSCTAHDVLTGGGAITLGTVTTAKGGTNQTSWTTGSIPYLSSATQFSEDNANFFWDGSNHRLGIGTTTPSSQLQINGSAAQVYLTHNAVSVGGFGEGDTVVTGGATTDLGIDALNASGNILFATGGTAERMRINSSGNVGIGVTSINTTAKFQVNGGIYGNATESDSVFGGNIGNPNSNMSFTGSGAYWGFRGDSAHAFNFDTYNGGTGKNVLTITQGGNVGIASSTPTSLFSIGTIGAQFAVNSSGMIQAAASQPATSTAQVIDWSITPPQVEIQLGTSATTITLINATTSPYWGSRKVVWLCNPGTTAGAVTWAGVEWIGTAPVQTTTASKCDTYSFDVTHATSTSAYKVAGTAGTDFQ